MNAKLTTITLSEQEIRSILIGLHGYAVDVSKEVQNHEDRTGNPHEFARMEYEEIRTLIRKVREA